VALSLVRAAEGFDSRTVGCFTESGFSIAAKTSLAFIVVITITAVIVIIIININEEVTMRYIKLLTTTLNTAAN
ncbi:MAG: hypothetical protein MJE68_28895, partial [Proteobacteria bacterium]|nr:hypothetical protein [Pseudomonadota bacterium]